VLLSPSLFILLEGFALIPRLRKFNINLWRELRNMDDESQQKCSCKNI